MRSIVTYLVVAAVALHTLLGCCGHHAHAASDDHKCSHEAEAADHVADRRSECPHSCVDAVSGSAPTNDHAAGEHGPPAHRSDPCAAKCSFIAPNRAEIDSRPDSIAFGFVTTAAIDAPALPPDSPRCERRSEDESPPPIRLHLFNQVLLI